MTAPPRATDTFAADDPRFGYDEITGYARSASDVIRLFAYATLTLALLAITRWAHDAILGFESDVVDALGFLDAPAERLLLDVTQLVAFLVSLAVLVFPVALRRFRLLGYLVVANVVSAVLVQAAVAWLDQTKSPEVANELATRAGVDLQGVLSPSTLASLAASFVILAPFVGARWRRAGAITIALFAVLRIALSLQLPVEVFFALALGASVGSAVLLVFGRPDQHPTMRAVAASLAASGLAVTALDPQPVDVHGSHRYLATLDDGTRVMVRIMSPAERSAELIYRAYRWLRFKNVGDERPFSSIRRAVEHEALVSLQARDVGTRTPRMRAVAEVGIDSMLITFDAVDGVTIDALDAADLTDDLLRDLWTQVAVLRAHRIAHRDLRHANVVVDGAARPWIVDFGFSEVAAADGLLDGDIAELLCALALLVGAERAVDTALSGLGAGGGGRDALRRAFPRLQLNALSAVTRASLRRRKGLLDDLQTTVETRCDVEKPEFVPLARIDRKLMLTVVMLVLVTYFLLPQLSDLPGIVDQVREADPIWFVPLAAASVLSYVGAALGIGGSVPARLRAVPTFLAQVAASFAGTLAPSSVGSLALNVRFLQKSGIDPAVAVPAVGIDSVAGIVVHLGLLVLFLVWAGRSAFGSVSFPDPEVFVVGAAVVLVLAAIAFAIPAIRRILRERLVPVLRRSVAGLAAVLRRPLNMALLIGGSAIVTLSYLVAMYLATRAFGGDLDFAEVGAVYLVASAVASAAPTPGGLGALEAATIAGLVAAGMPNAVAVPSVFLFRLATFWLPIFPGWAAFHYLQREDYL